MGLSQGILPDMELLTEILPIILHMKNVCKEQKVFFFLKILRKIE